MASTIFSSTERPKIGVGVMVMKEGKLLLGKRTGSFESQVWGFPGGHLEFGETIESCARRELLEETGLEAASLEILHPWAENMMENGTKHYITLFAVVKKFSGELQVLEPNK